MKKLLTLLLVAFSLGTQAQTVHDVSAKTEIESLIVYLDGSEVTREASVTLKRGRNRVIFTGLSPKLDGSNVQVSINGRATVLAINHKINHLTRVEEKPRIRNLRDSLDLVQKNMTNLNNRLDAFRTEKDMINQNRSIGGSDNGVPMAELQQAAEFYRSRIMEINKLISNDEYKLKKLNERVVRINQELNELNAKNSYSRGEISVLLETSEAAGADVTVRYLVSDCGWTATYDIKADETSTDIDLVYRAKVYNNTDIDWKNVKMTLSTGDPSLSASKPMLSPWYLDYNSRNDLAASQGRLNTALDAEITIRGARSAPGNIVFEEVEVPELSAEFEIKTRYTIPSDASPYLVEVEEHKLPATFKHHAVPKLDKDAFLLARIAGWEELNLVDGDANIYYSNTFVGRSYIRTRTVEDTLDISLGRDTKVLVTRIKRKDFSSKKAIGNNRKETHSFEITLKNNRQAPIDISVLDQIPVSQDSEIEVTKMEVSGANMNLLTGEASWKMKLQPGESKSVVLTYTIKYPKSKPIQTNQYRQKARARW